MLCSNINIVSATEFCRIQFDSMRICALGLNAGIVPPPINSNALIVSELPRYYFLNELSRLLRGLFLCPAVSVFFVKYIFIN